MEKSSDFLIELDLSQDGALPPRRLTHQLKAVIVEKQIEECAQSIRMDPECLRVRQYAGQAQRVREQRVGLEDQRLPAEQAVRITRTLVDHVDG